VIRPLMPLEIPWMRQGSRIVDATSPKIGAFSLRARCA
jgi:hypothetical protein